jgi:tetratricopeptide (TPR) repeat protein
MGVTNIGNGQYRLEHLVDWIAEKDSITAALKPLTDQGVVHLTFIEGNNTWKKLMDALLPNRTHILHFIGHGTFDEKNNEGVLIMADEDGKTELVDSERLRVLVQGRSRLALIVLNSCLGTLGGDAQPFSSVAAGLVKSGIPAVIAMQFEISDEAAREISETFYTSLSLNMPVDAALTEARRRIFLSNRNSLEWATPILYMQVPDGQLFEFKGSRPRTDSVAQSVKPAFETNAAKRYAEGEDAMARGDWAAAVVAYRGAMVYVPNYRDVGEKLSICASRSNAATLLGKAQTSISMKHYGPALQALNEAAKLDPTLDVDQLRETAECGEKYQQAIAELHRGHRNAGIDLLREAAGRQPDGRWLPVVEEIYSWHYKNEKYLRNEKSLARVAMVYSQQTATYYGGDVAIEQAVPVLREGRRRPHRVVHAEAHEPAKQQVVVQLLQKHPFAAHGVEYLQQQRPQQLLGRNRWAARMRVELGKAMRHTFQNIIHHLANGPQGVIGRHPLLRRNVAEHGGLLKVVSSHPVAPLRIIAAATKMLFPVRRFPLPHRIIMSFSASC